MSDIDRKARELLAAEQDQHGRCQTSEALAAIKKALTPPDGYVLVPVEPTEAMVHEGLVAGDGHDWTGPGTVWDAMLAARPEVME